MSKVFLDANAMEEIVDLPQVVNFPPRCVAAISFRERKPSGVCERVVFLYPKDEFAVQYYLDAEVNGVQVKLTPFAFRLDFAPDVSRKEVKKESCFMRIRHLLRF